MENNNVKIAVLSGKGGTGKTLVSVNLASVAGESIYIDCDVEEPNGHLFFKPTAIYQEDIAVKIPVVNESLCSGCRKCVDFCKFNALAFIKIKNKPYIFEEVCHSCGGCMLICPEKAISERERYIGKVQKGVSGNVTVNSGILNTGEESGIPIIKKLLEESASYEDFPVFIDCPPGSACMVMESIKNVDYCILVAEPTVFGVHNLSMVYDLVKLFGKPYGVVLNKCLDGENPAEIFCISKNIPILGRIPFDPELGKLNSEAKIAVRESERFRELFLSLYKTIMKEARHETTADSKR
ncbi:MAG: 4Fe-4S binding protein [Clostridiales bacterium]|nr:4Fe-4S binding protein [Clostridiales bacterium]